jgi:hypothetical protein
MPIYRMVVQIFQRHLPGDASKQSRRSFTLIHGTMAHPDRVDEISGSQINENRPPPGLTV